MKCGVCDLCFRTRDYYHTCYCLSGLSVAQHFADGKYSCTRVVGNKDLNEVVSIIFRLFHYAAQTARSYRSSFMFVLSVGQSVGN